jgi:hypothetical protein
MRPLLTDLRKKKILVCPSDTGTTRSTGRLNVER